MKSLEDEVEDLAYLDELRVRSAALRDEGRKALQAVLEMPDMVGWEVDGDSIETALMIKSLCYRGAKSDVLQPLVAKLERMSLQEAFDTKSDEVPVLRAARAMQALVAAPDS